MITVSTLLLWCFQVVSSRPVTFMNTASTLLLWKFSSFLQTWHIYEYSWEYVIIIVAFFTFHPDLTHLWIQLVRYYCGGFIFHPDLTHLWIQRVRYYYCGVFTFHPDLIHLSIQLVRYYLWSFHVSSRPDTFMNTVGRRLLWRFHVSSRPDTFMDPVRRTLP